MGIYFIIILVLIRYGLLWVVNKKALPKAAYFPPMVGKTKFFYVLYQFVTVALVFSISNSSIKPQNIYFKIGVPIYIFGLIVLVMATLNFARSSSDDILQTGLYRYSRNPMYIGYFLYLLGCVFLTQSIISGILLILFQVSEHWIILAEEKWCQEKFGSSYVQYMKKVRRYI